MDFLNSSFRVGRLFGITVRVHIFFIIWAAFRIFDSQGDMANTAGFLAMLFGIILVHEFGHCFGARSVGGHAEDILMWPLGGLAFAQAPMRPWPQFVTIACGPLVNVVFCLISGGILFAYAGTIEIFSLNPLSPLRAFPPGPDWLPHVAMFYWVNYWLLAFNLLPIYPMDGGQLFQTLLWPFLGLQRSMEIACSLGLVGAVLLGLWGISGGGGGILIMIAIFGGFTCWQRLQQLRYGMLVEDRYTRYDPVRRSTDETPWWRRILGQKKAPPRAAQQNPNPGGWQARVEERHNAEEEVDRILKKVHDQGIHSLTYIERQTLERATRDRQTREREYERRE